MELRHLRYFIAVVEEGSMTVAAEKRLHTSQPSLSRQIRDLEYEVGAQLLVRTARGIEMTDAGKAFLDHARLALAQAEAAREAARRAARPLKPTLAVGFLSGQEVTWLARASLALASDLQNIEMTVSSEHSPDLAEGLSMGRLDVAFMRAESGHAELEYITVATEPFVVVMPSDHRLTAHKKVDVRELADELFIGGSDVAGPMRDAIERYLADNDLQITPAHRVHNLTMAMSLIASTRGVALLPAYAEKLLPWSVASRPLKGEPPTIDLVIGYNRTNRSPILELFLSRTDQLIEP
ncbi:LysR family transcriptional regulator [Paraburkholderia sp. HD33-4]|uniref:LysR family transcriptional regulator n=1 Tax=Paraburkholderia sp. HD33-4 TaxID=2883242 RepID=UPI001F47F4B5|nr:LysR family transcriptional regulator [Paraburkholderia sp. HD33-4]